MMEKWQVVKNLVDLVVPPNAGHKIGLKGIGGRAAKHGLPQVTVEVPEKVGEHQPKLIVD